MSDGRAQSVSINYTLSLVIVAMLVSGMFISMNGFLEQERERTADSQFEVIGNRIAADLGAADRLAASADGSAARVEVRTTVPRSVAGSGYEITIAASSPPGDEYYDVNVTLRATGFPVSRTVTVRTRHEVDDGTLSGGNYVVVFDGSELAVSNR